VNCPKTRGFIRANGGIVPSPNGNCSIRVLQRIESHPEKLALWSVHDGIVSFREVGERAAARQKAALELGLQAGDTALVMALPGAELYVTLVALLGLGVGVVFVEPWMPAQHIEHVLKLVNVKAAFFDRFGMFWRLRNASLRSLRAIYLGHQRPDTGNAASLFHAAEIPAHLPATISFTTGTTGVPKGVVRSHAYLWELHEILEKYGGDKELDGPDLAVFPNLALYHLGTGRGSLLVPSNWSISALSHIETLDKSIWPQSLSCGPAFLRHVLDHNKAFASLKSVNVGGAMIECELLERSLKALPRSTVRQIYGGTEVEPVAFVDARISLENTRRKGFMHALNVGNPISELKLRFTEDSVLWVSGVNVCPEYIGNTRESMLNKMRDGENVLWHCMGDRMFLDGDGLWYMGRQGQALDDFIFEQKIYARLGHTRAFLHRDNIGNAIFVADDDAHQVEKVATDLLGEKPVVMTSVLSRDRRHRSRIDRRATWEKGLRMLRWWMYLKERSPLLVLIFLALGPVVSGYLLTLGRGLCAPQSTCPTWGTIFLHGMLAVLASVMFMIAARMMDELKDYEKDKLANPSRPLPRGLVSLAEMSSGIRIVMAVLIALSVAMFFAVSPLAGWLFLASSLYLWLMYKEFYVGQQLAHFPLFYALSHQIVGIPLYLFGVTLFWPEFVNTKLAWLFVAVNVCASLSYEFARKLKADAHPAAKTYRQIYGLSRASLIALLFQAIALVVTFLARTELPAIVVLALFQIPTCAVVLLHSLRDGLHKPSEGLAALSVLASAWAGVLALLKF
jgi:acyl-CoA synthetase (AMP-forming)/AMP-acid ligase II